MNSFMRNFKFFFLVCLMLPCVGAMAGDVRGRVKAIHQTGNAKTVEVEMDGNYAGEVPLCHRNNHQEKKFHVDISTENGKLNYEALKQALEAGRSVHILSTGGCRDGKEKIELIMVM